MQLFYCYSLPESRMCSVHSMKPIRPICDVTCCSLPLTGRTAHLLKLKHLFEQSYSLRLI
jgi:hypothetical protein